MSGKIVFDMKRLAAFVLAGVVMLGIFLALSIRSTNQLKEGGDDVDSLKIEDISEGEGEGANVGDTITVNYRGTLEDGSVFDSSYDRGEPFSFKLGEGSVIEGWEKGLLGMKTGGRRKLTIPPELGYGDKEAGSIPSNSVLIFEIELLKID